MRVPFVVYADLECTLEKTETEDTSKYQYHRVFSLAYYVHCSYNASLCMYQSRRDKDCVAWFAEEHRVLAHNVKSILSANVPMEFTWDNLEKLNNATHCHMRKTVRARRHAITVIWQDDSEVPRISNCNLNYIQHNSHRISVVFHNISGYDAHFIIKEIATVYDGRVELLPVTKEKYISFTKNVKSTEDERKKNNIELRFIDSYKFLTSSLDKLASYLSTDKLRIMQCEFCNLSVENFDLLTCKGIFPYEYIDCVEKLEDTCLPRRESFYNSLTGDTVSEVNYAHAVNVWQRFSIRTFGEYSDLYLKTDVLLLADIFENFRDSWVSNYGLDPAYYYTLPDFTWDAMLKHTGKKLKHTDNKFRIAYWHWYGHVRWTRYTRRPESMFRQVRASQQ